MDEEKKECEQMAKLTLGYLQSLIEAASTDAAKEMMRDWQFVIEQTQEEYGDE